MSTEADSKGSAWDSIHIFDTPERDNPKYGSVTLVINDGPLAGSLRRMTYKNAEALASKLNEYINSKESK